MRGSLALIVAAVSTAAVAEPQCERPRNFYQSKVVGGSLAKIGDWPGLAALRTHDPNRRYSFYFCGATVIAPTTVLTAAHCVVDTGLKKSSDGSSYVNGFGRRVEVVIGTDDLSKVGPQNIRGIREITVHPQYKSAGNGNDLALIYLDVPWDGSPTRLSLNPKADPGAGKMVMVAGFGAQKENDTGVTHTRDDGETFSAASAQLFEVGLPTVAEAVCKATYRGQTIGLGQICAGYLEGEKDSCQGDSGGPLVTFDRNGCPYQVGVVSWGKGCAEKNAYGVYSRTSAYADWLRQQTRAVREMDEADFDDGAALDLVKASFTQLDDLLGPARDRARVTLNVGNQVKLHQAAVFNVASSVPGTLILLDINANGEVVQLFPSKYSKVHAVTANTAMTIPDNTSYSFPAQEPIGKGRLVAIVAPSSFNVDALVTDPEEIGKGFEVKANPQSQSYLMNLIEQIRIAVGARGFVVTPTGSLPDWAMGTTDYEIIR
jgi:secreted trypsin-like serine protease